MVSKDVFVMYISLSTMLNSSNSNPIISNLLISRLMSNKFIQSQFVNKKQRIVQLPGELPAIVFTERLIYWR